MHRSRISLLVILSILIISLAAEKTPIAAADPTGYDVVAALTHQEQVLLPRMSGGHKSCDSIASKIPPDPVRFVAEDKEMRIPQPSTQVLNSRLVIRKWNYSVECPRMRIRHVVPPPNVDTDRHCSRP